MFKIIAVILVMSLPVQAYAWGDPAPTPSPNPEALRIEEAIRRDEAHKRAMEKKADDTNLALSILAGVGMFFVVGALLKK